ncbi:MAG: hypothetical protein HY887_06510 [Deltaproteobacteria bacterium]|nr:hypothetical protein [Deltaproteobacteria bacterium]
MKAFFKSRPVTLLFALAIFLGLAAYGTTSLSAEQPKAQPKAAPKAEKKEAAPAVAPQAGGKLDPTDPSSVLYLDTAGKPAGLGDPNKPPGMGYKVGRGWHPQALTSTSLPKDKYGLIDWAKIVREKIVKPRHSLNIEDEEMPPLQLDIVITAKSDFVNDVLYPHEIHTYWLKCEVCHDTKGGAIFVPKKGGNTNMSMVAIANGQYCGRCHNKVSFPLGDCKRCHTVPKGAAK